VSSVKLTLNEAHANCRTDDDRPYSVGQHDRSGTAIKNTEPHQKCCCNRNPPRTGPSAPPAIWQVARTAMAY
jgi:hypothetical protein